jgi:hypothetical protein
MDTREYSSRGRMRSSSTTQLGDQDASRVRLGENEPHRCSGGLTPHVMGATNGDHPGERQLLGLRYRYKTVHPPVAEASMSCSTPLGMWT